MAKQLNVPVAHSDEKAHRRILGGAINRMLETETLHKGVTVQNPVNGDSLSIWVPSVDITIQDVSAHRQAGTSIIFNIEHGTDPSNPGTSLWSSNQTVTANTTLDQTFDAFNDATVLADNIIKLEIVTVTGSVTEFHVTLEYTID